MIQLVVSMVGHLAHYLAQQMGCRFDPVVRLVHLWAMNLLIQMALMLVHMM